MCNNPGCNVDANSNEENKELVPARGYVKGEQLDVGGRDDFNHYDPDSTLRGLREKLGAGPVAEVPASIRDLSNTVDSIQEAFNVLMAKLRPVTRDYDTGGVPTGEGYETEVARAIHQESLRLNDLLERMRSLEQALEV